MEFGKDGRAVRYKGFSEVTSMGSPARRIKIGLRILRS